MKKELPERIIKRFKNIFSGSLPNNLKIILKYSACRDQKQGERERVPTVTVKIKSLWFLMF